MKVTQPAEWKNISQFHNLFQFQHTVGCFSTSLQQCSLLKSGYPGIIAKSPQLVLVEEEVEEENSAKKGGLHLRGAAGGELNVEAVAVGEELLAHVGGGLRDGPHILPFHVSDDKIGLRRTKDVE